MNYLSLCSGIEAASMAWHPLGWKPVAFSEIEKFPSELLGHHYPNVPNMGDMTKYKEWKLNDTIDLVVGGTPCQSFSVAGLRKGLEDPRGNLALTFCGILDKFRPKWFIWENVPGVLSSGGGRDFGSFLGAVAELGYGFSYRVLDAQNFGVPQRRRRVFVVGHLGDWRPAAEVLFESESLSWDSKKSKQARQDSPGFIETGFGAYRQSDVGGTTRASGGVLGGGSETFTVSQTATPKVNKDVAQTLNASDYKHTQAVSVYENHPSDSRVKEMGDTCQTVTSRWGTGGGNIPIALAENTIGRQPLNGGNGNGFTEGGPMYTLNATGVHGIAHGFEPGIAKREGNPSRFTKEKSPTLRANMGDNQVAVAHGVAVDVYNQSIDGDVAATVTSAVGGTNTSGPKIMHHNMAVRKLTPIECERLQGFPDGYTNIKENCPDGPRYKALGNSMAVPVMKWIGQRIANYDA